MDGCNRIKKSFFSLVFLSFVMRGRVEQQSSIVENYNKTPHSGIRNIKPNDAAETPNKERISSLNFENQ